MTNLVFFAKRFDFRCWKCGEKYSIFREMKLDAEKESEQKIKVSCSHCGEEAVADFFPFRNKKKIILRSANEKEGDFSYEYKLPKILPTSKL